jgi:hypothetical protein
LLAVPFGRYPGATFGLLGLAAFIFLLMGANDQREFLIRLTIVILAGLGAFFFRRTLVEAYPDAGVEGLGDFGDRARAKAEDLWSKRPKSFPGRKGGGEAGQGADAPAAAPAAAGAPAPTGDSAAETAVLPAAADPETARLDQLERLADMHGRGILNDEEFASEKRRIMGDGS